MTDMADIKTEVSMRQSSVVKIFLVTFVGLGLLVGACSSSNNSAGGDETVNADPATTAADSTTSTEYVTEQFEAVAFDNDFGTSIAPILSNSCASCHNPGGPGTSHWQLATAGDAAEAATSILSLVGNGTMPPWPAGPESIPFHNDRSLRPDQVTAIVDWAAAGAELDVDPSSPIVASQNLLELAEVDAVLAPAEPYQGSVEKTDDYRCFVYDPELSEPAWLLGYNFVPDQTEVVHHAIGYMLPAAAREKAAAKDASEPGSGWECYGSSGLGQDEIFIGWAPGQGPSQYSKGAALKVPAGAFFVVQIHYHYEDDAPADQSTLEVDMDYTTKSYDEIQVSEYVAPAEIPCSSDQDGPLCDRAAAYARALDRFGPDGVQSDRFNAICGVTPADFADMTDGVASSSCELPIYGFGKIVSILGHQHEIGASFRMTLNPGKPTERILLDIPKWDFDWQYNYEPAEDIILNFGDTVRIECTWDRSLQADGIEPSYILWADGTNDEMCFSTIVTQAG